MVARLIPAHAGKTTPWCAVWLSCPAHPRSRGENRVIVGILPGERGSSPLTRGKHRPHRIGVRRTGLIPAHAGKTHPPRHPCGAGRGSSPLTRGKLECGRQVDACGRLIPAHAGKTNRWSNRHRTTRAHPRSRGENISAASKASSSPGSSPLTRGKHRRAEGECPGGGLIPAHAGKTRLGAVGTVFRWAHPRSRGENTLSWHYPIR